MRVVRSDKDLEQSINMTKAEAKAAFNNDMVYMEKYRRIRAIEIPGRRPATIYLAERDCSMQRRHQKVVEEAGTGHHQRNAPLHRRAARKPAWKSATAVRVPSSSCMKTASSISSK